MQGDPLVDPALSDARTRGVLGAWNDHLRTLHRSDDRLPTDADPALANLLERTRELPPWLDPDLLCAAQRLYERHAAEIILALLGYGLPSGYGAPKVAAVLTATGRLSTYRFVHQRLASTAQLLVEVTRPGALIPCRDPAGVLTCQKVRLAHGFVRSSLVGRAARWDELALGVPVNQEDQAGTIACFGLVPMLGLLRLGVQLRERDIHAWLHLFRVVGFVCGVDPRLLPADRASWEVLWGHIARRNIAVSGPNDDGRALMQALLAWYGAVLPARALGVVPSTMTRFFLGDALADTLGVPRGPFATKLVPYVLRACLRGARGLSVHARAQRLARDTVSALAEGRWPAQTVVLESR